MVAAAGVLCRGAGPPAVASRRWLSMSAAGWSRASQQQQQQHQPWGLTAGARLCGSPVHRWCSPGIHAVAFNTPRNPQACPRRLYSNSSWQPPKDSRPSSFPSSSQPPRPRDALEMELENVIKKQSAQAQDPSAAIQEVVADAANVTAAPAPAPAPASETLAPEATAAESHKPDDGSKGAKAGQSGGDGAARASRLPSAVELRRTKLGARFSAFMDTLQERVVVASQALSDLTGYTAIDQIKARNAELEVELAAAQAALHTTRREYQAVNERRAATQREVTTLLARKDSWAPADLERFTALYRRDHELESAAARAVEALTDAETAESKLSSDLTAGILKRYHEEQVWSDRIRRQSTWGTWGLMGINVVLFILLQVFAEPWRRRRLMRGIAEAESGLLDDVRHDLADVRAALAAVTAALPEAKAAAPAPAPEAAPEAAALPPQPPQPPQPVAAPSPPPPVTPTSSPQPWQPPHPWSWDDAKAWAADSARWKAWARDLCSERLVSLRMRDVSLLALESAAAGAAVLGSLVLALRRS